MSRTVWRIASDTPAYQADDLSGTGGRVVSGRWHERGIPVVYASETRALACLETVVHFGAEALPCNRYLVEITIPEKVWRRAEVAHAASLDVGWDAEPPGQVSLRFGTAWLRSGRSALLVVPSVIVPEECNVLINPVHGESGGISAVKTRKWLYDPRLG